jgi:hypothetical protein
MGIRSGTEIIRIFHRHSPKPTTDSTKKTNVLLTQAARININARK